MLLLELRRMMRTCCIHTLWKVHGHVFSFSKLRVTMLLKLSYFDHKSAAFSFTPSIKEKGKTWNLPRGKGMKWEKHFILEDFFFGDWMLMRVIIIICCLCSCCFGSLGSASILQHVEKQLILLTRKTKLHMAGQVAFCSSFNLLDYGKFSKQQLFMPKSSPMLVRRSCFLI